MYRMAAPWIRLSSFVELKLNQGAVILYGAASSAFLGSAVWSGTHSSCLCLAHMQIRPRQTHLAGAVLECVKVGGCAWGGGTETRLQ